MVNSSQFKQELNLIIICLAVAALIGTQGWSIASPIANTWLKATIKIENEWGNNGTGFLVFREIKQNLGKTFLVTNKHVLNEEPNKRESARHLKLFVNIERNDGTIVGQSFEKVSLLDVNGKRLWREHENPDVDVLAVDISWLLNSQPKLHKALIHYSDFITPALMKTQDVTIADEVLLIGYPSGLAHASTNFPLVRQGLIATRIGEKINIEVNDSAGKKTMVEIPAFLIDATVIPGSSGSPVILKPVQGLTIKGNSGEAKVLPSKNPYLLGIVSATRKVLLPLRKDKDGRILYFPALEGLGLVYDADTIKETIELFFK